jgi:hypothetical protein
MKFKIPDYLPQGLLIAGGCLRIAGMAAGSIWYDESYSLKLAAMPLLEMVRVAILDFNPPGFEILIWPLVKLFGANLFGLRILSLSAALLGLWIAWLLIKELNVYQKTFAAALIALLPIGMWAAQDGRNYALFSTLYLAGFWFVKNKKWAGMMAVMGLMSYLHVTGVIYSAALAITAFIQDKKNFKNIMIYSGIAAILYIPQLINISKSSSLDFWLNPVNFTETIALSMFTGLIQGPWLDLFSIVFWVSLIGSGLIILGPWINSMINPVTLRIGSMITALLKIKPVEKIETENESDYVPLFFWALGPIGLMAILGMVYKPILFYRSMVGIVTPMAILFAVALTPKRLTFTTWILPYSWGMLILISLLGWSPTLKGGDIDHLAKLINHQLQPGDVVYHATATSYLPLAYYLNDPGYLLNQQNEHDGLLQDRIQDKFEIKKAALEDLDYNRAWIVWARDPILSTNAQNRMSEYIQDSQFMGSAGYFQFSEIELYLKEGK